MAVKLTAEQILKVIQDNLSEDEFAYGDFSSEELGLGKSEQIAQYGGTDKGSTWYSVRYFSDHDVYIRIDGHYQSHHGTEFYDGHGYEVRPQERVITVFE